MKFKHIQHIRFLLICLFLWGITGCSNLFDVDTAPMITDAQIKDLATARQVLNGAYGSVQNLSGFFKQGNSVQEIQKDNVWRVEAIGQQYQRYYNKTDYDLSVVWRSFMNTLNIANFLILRLPDLEIESKENTERQQLLGEAYFLRGFVYYHLALYWGAAPLYFAPIHDLAEYPKIQRTPELEVWQQSTKDLAQAAQLLPERPRHFDSAGSIFPSQPAAKALLGRIALIQQNWHLTETLSSEIIESGLFELETDYSLLFKGINRENIYEIYFQPSWPDYQRWCWSIEPSFTSLITRSGGQRNLSSRTPLSNNHFADIGVNYPIGYYPNKYRYRGHLIFLRLAELYLNRAEARVRQGNIAGALSDLNIITQRAGKQIYNFNSAKLILQTIDIERRIEFCFEGHRLRDLLRTPDWNDPAKNLYQSLVKWESHKRYLPLPEAELAINPQFLQNPGY